MASQFVTLAVAQALAKKLENVGGGVKPYNPQNMNESGIYIPDYGIRQIPRPDDADTKEEFYHFRFNNGASGFNAGLIYQQAKLFPASWVSMVGDEVTRAAGHNTEAWIFD